MKKTKETSTKKSRSQKIICYLLKETGNPCKSVINDDSNESLIQYKKIDEKNELYFLLDEYIPPLFNFIELKEEINIKTLPKLNAIVVKKVKVNKKEISFALSFGGRHLLRSDAYYEKFGLKLTLNLISENEISKMTTKEISDNPKLISQQLAINGKQDFFRINDKLDILNGISGKIDTSHKKIKKFIVNNEITRTIEGKNSFIFNTSLSDIDELLEELYKIYTENNYKNKGFSWIDNISKITGEDKLILDNMLLKKIQNNPNEIITSLPMIIDFEEIGGYFVKRKKFQEFPTISEVFSENCKDLEIETLMKTEIKILGNDEKEFKNFKFYKCINTFLEYNKEYYIIFVGNWYKLSKKYIDEVNQKYEEIIKNKLGFKFLNFNKEIHKNENGYNKKLANRLEMKHWLWMQIIFHMEKDLPK